MYQGILIHYSEIAIKGRNRMLFEKKLVENINLMLGKKYVVKREHGYIFIPFEESLSLNSQNHLKETLKNIPGIAHFSFVVVCEKSLEAIKLKSKQLLENEKFTSFKVATKRSDKSFSFKSPQINALIGEHILLFLKNKKVDVFSPDLVVFIEICEKQTFIFINKEKGVGGLPVGVSGKVLCSLSGGIDSCVAGYLMFKRGCSVSFVHVYNNTLTKEHTLNKIKTLVKILNKFQTNIKLYVVPFSNLQAHIVSYIPEEYRMIVYRRFMLRIISQIAKKEKAKAIVTGDSVGQVASQTLENLNVIYSASKLLVLPPLLGFHKNEIISLAKQIGTYETSIIPYPDCCCHLVSKHPKTKSLLKDVLFLEEKLSSQQEFIEQAVASCDIFLFRNGREEACLD